MAYVSVPKDLTKVKNKVAFNLTKRQIAAPIPIQISCLLVRLNASLFFTFVKSFGTLT